MARYLLGRLGQAVLVLFLTYTGTFFLLVVLPSDPLATILYDPDNPLAPDQAAMLYRYYDLDGSVWVQYLHRLGRLLHGDLGFSITTGQPVTNRVLDALAPTLALTGFALVFALVIALALVMTSHLTRRRWIGNLLDHVPNLFVATPTFWLGLLVIQLFSFRLGLFSVVSDDGVRSLTFAALSLAVPISAPIARVFDSGIRSAQAEPYTSVLYTKGLSRRRIFFSHSVRAALLPTMTIAGLVLGDLIAGSVAIETVFAREGVGQVTEKAVSVQDLPVVQGVVLLTATVFVLVNLVVDLLYVVVDPRLRRGSRSAAPA